MFTFLDFPLYLMETLKRWSSLHGYVMFMFLTTISKGSACEAPSSPECFRKNTDEILYMCEWSMNKTEGSVTFHLYIDNKKYGSTNETWYKIHGDTVIQGRDVNIWVEAYAGSINCTSPRKSVTLVHLVKYDAPQSISMSWLGNNLSLIWKAAEKHPALAEVLFRKHNNTTESWEKKLINTTTEASKYQVILVNLLNHSAYQVQIRHRSTQAKNPLWSKWSPVVTVPAELEHEPEVTVTTKLLNGTRAVMLTWKILNAAAAVSGVTYRLEDTQSSHGCPCANKTKTHVKTNKSTIYVSYSAVNISVTAINAAGHSPLANIQLPAKPAANLKICDNTEKEKMKKNTCKQWYELQDRELKPENVITLANKKSKGAKQIKASIKDYVRYLYFEHRCDGGKPRTVKMCLYYKKEGAPQREPQNFTVTSETLDSANLSWETIAIEDQRGFVTHYSLCSEKISSQDERKECRNISASLLTYRLENLTPGAKYNISLAGVTKEGEGPSAKLTIYTQPEKPVNVWWSFGLLFVFFLSSTMCTIILKRIKNKIFPPVPTPVIPDFFTYQPESQEMLEEKEEVHELMLSPLHPEVKSVPEDTEETTALHGEWDAGSDEDMGDERSDSRMSGESSDESPGSTDQALRSSREGEITDLEQVDNEIAMLIYRNGLVFDVKTD
ncbi:interleukin-12 receptor subunit beta-1 isoform X2 [Lates calcarifer]|uniref:Interleukin-12 receptor subunit beta-1 isoform X2 n=1 Tax=Lates calcarifer TaxID=8187 RepID=A0AAJ7LQ67_LATCA|nr:interleukin-12 receptor subunit beta-1 isoform X2 [Lates calcarifer]